MSFLFGAPQAPPPPPIPTIDSEEVARKRRRERARMSMGGQKSLIASSGQKTSVLGQQAQLLGGL